MNIFVSTESSSPAAATSSRRLLEKEANGDETNPPPNDICTQAQPLRSIGLRFWEFPLVPQPTPLVEDAALRRQSLRYSTQLWEMEDV